MKRIILLAFAIAWSSHASIAIAADSTYTVTPLSANGWTFSGSFTTDGTLGTLTTTNILSSSVVISDGITTIQLGIPVDGFNCVFSNSVSATATEVTIRIVGLGPAVDWCDSFSPKVGIRISAGGSDPGAFYFYNGTLPAVAIGQGASATFATATPAAPITYTVNTLSANGWTFSGSFTTDGTLGTLTTTNILSSSVVISDGITTIQLGIPVDGFNCAFSNSVSATATEVTIRIVGLGPAVDWCRSFSPKVGIRIEAGATDAFYFYAGLPNEQNVGQGQGATPPFATATPDVSPIGAIVIDDDSIDNGLPPNFFAGPDINDDIADVGLREPLPFFRDNVGSTLVLHTGEVGDEGWFALTSIPQSWGGLLNFVEGGPGLGSPDANGDREALLDKIPDVIPLRATGLKMLEGQKVCAVVYDGDVSINIDYDPVDGGFTEGSLKGANLGTVAFQVISVTELTGFSSSSLPQVEIEILDAEEVCGGALELLTDAPEPISSSEPFDVVP